jgi:hypothetical protein
MTKEELINKIDNVIVEAFDFQDSGKFSDADVLDFFEDALVRIQDIYEHEDWKCD